MIHYRDDFEFVVELPLYPGEHVVMMHAGFGCAIIGTSYNRVFRVREGNDIAQIHENWVEDSTRRIH